MYPSANYNTTPKAQRLSHGMQVLRKAGRFLVFAM
jgi:hypothetical protein